MKKLATYFSASGVTRKLAKKIAEAVEADLYEIKPLEAYSDADLNWMNKESRSSVEMNDPDCRPALADHDGNIENYDVIYVGFPIWWGREPSVVDTFLEAYDFTGKIIVVYATSGGSRMGKIAERIQSIVSNDAKVIDGKVLSSFSGIHDLKKWNEKLNIL